MHFIFQNDIFFNLNIFFPFWENFSQIGKIIFFPNRKNFPKQEKKWKCLKNYATLSENKKKTKRWIIFSNGQKFLNVKNNFLVKRNFSPKEPFFIHRANNFFLFPFGKIFPKQEKKFFSLTGKFFPNGKIFPN